MKAKKMKLRALVVCATLCFSTGLFFACTDNSDTSSSNSVPNSSQTVETSVELTETELRLELYESYPLTATVTGGEAVWSTSDASVVSVEKGVVTAKGVGTATVTVSVGDKSKSCVITVYDADVAASLALNTKTVNVDKDETFTLKVSALWKGEAVNDNVSYTVSLQEGENVASVTKNDDGTFTVTGLAYGQSTWCISGVVRGVAISETLQINVVDAGVTVLLSDEYQPVVGGYATKMTLSLTSEYANQTIAPQIYDNNELVAGATVAWTSSNAEVATVEGGKLVAKSAGTARLSATYNTTKIYVDVEVKKPVLQMTESFVIERLDGTGTQTIALTESLAGTPTLAYFENGVNVLDSGDSAQIVLTATDMPKVASQMGEGVAFTVETERAVYEYEVSLYTQIINDANELKNYFAVGSSAYPNDAKRAGGYFVLGNDIAFGGAAFALSGEDVGFTGVFDGKGYAIDNISVSWTGLFGTVGDGTVVKNLAMTNVVNNHEWVSAIFARTYETATDTVRFENIYLHFSEMKGSYRSNAYNGILFGGATWAAQAKNFTFENIVISVDNYTELTSPTYVLGNVAKNAGNIKNVYVYGTKKAYVNYADGTTQLRSRLNGDSDEYAVYETRGDMAVAGNAYDEFTANEFWKLAGGLPYPAKLAYTEKYTVQFVDGSTTLQQNVYSENETLTVAPSPSKDGYAFVGWKLVGAEELYDFTATDALKVTADRKFCAVWADTVESAKVSEVEVVTGINGESVSATVASTNSAFTLDVSDIKDSVSGQIQSVTIGGKTYTSVAYSDGVIQVNEAIDKRTYGVTRFSALFANDGEMTAVAGNALFITLKISNQEELKAYTAIGHDVAPAHTCANVSDPVHGYFVLDSNITCTENLTLGCVNWLGTTFYGTFDGRGYTIDNYKNSATWWAFTYRLGNNAVIRNIAFTNLDNSTDKTNGSLLACESWNGSGNVIENIYLHYSNYVNGGYSLLVGKGGNSNNVTYKNIIVTAHKVSGETANAVIAAQQGNDGATVIQNVYAYGLGNTVVTDSTNATGNYKAYADKAAMIAVNNDYTAFTETEFWTLAANGLPYPKKMEYVETYTVTFMDGTATVDTQIYFENAILVVPATPVKTGYAFKGWSFGEGTDLYNFDAANAKKVTADMTFKAVWIESATSATLSQVEVVTAIANAGTSATISQQAQSFTLDVNDVKAKIVGTLTKLVVGDTTYTSGISYANGVITVNHAPALNVYGAFTYSAFFTGDKEMSVTGKVLFATMVITTYDELKSFEAIGKLVYDNDSSTANYIGYYMLGANIDCTVSGAASSYNATGKFQGTFDGCGYKISNLKFGNKAFFGEVLDGTVIKNFALTNTENSGEWGSGILANNRDNTDAVRVSFENIYIHLPYVIETWSSDGAYNTLIMGKYSWNTGSANVTYTNIVIVADNYSNQKGMTGVVNAPANSGNIQNVYICGYTAGAVNMKEGSETSRGLNGDSTDKDKYAEYSAISGLNADIAAGKIAATDFTNTGYWTYDATNGLQFIVKA